MKKRILSVLFLVIPIVTFAQEKGLDQQIDEAFKPISDFFSEVIFFKELRRKPLLMIILKEGS